MAVSAIKLFSAQSQMTGSELLIVTIMTIEALLRYPTDQQTFLFTYMWLMTPETLEITRRAMSVFCHKSVGQISMTGQAESAALIREQFSELTSVR